MNKLTLFIACCTVLMSNTIYGQLSKEKKYEFLRNYEAPNFKQKRLNLYFDLGGGSKAKFSNNTGHFAERTSLGYYQYSNMNNYQGDFSSHISSRINWDKSDLGSTFFSSNSLGMRTTNRFYFNPKWFVGVFGAAVVGHQYRSELELDDMEAIGLSIEPTLSIGSGRLEPIQYARNAMDIEKQLKKGNRLGDDYSISELNQIADQLAQINNVRFYDFRLRRIEQFEAIDATLREIGGISDFDVAYFAHLADAYLYAQSFRRASGFRNEVGIASSTRLDHSISSVEVNDRLRYSANLYYYYSYNLPQSYAIQHTLFTSAIIGVNAYKDSNIEEPYIEQNGWINLGYEVGVFPTTRTNFNFGVKAGVESSGADFGSELYANGAVYLSPQFRLSFEANYSPESDYRAPYFMAIPSIRADSYEYTFGGSISIQYAIF